MSHLVLAKSVSRHRKLRTATFPVQIRIGKFFTMFSLALAIGVIGFFYLAKFTDVNTKGYQLKKLEIEHESLVSNRERNSVGIAKEKSLSSVREAAINLNMVAVKQVSYLQQDSAVAQGSVVLLGQLN